MLLNPLLKEPLRTADVFREQTGLCWKKHRKETARHLGVKERNNGNAALPITPGRGARSTKVTPALCLFSIQPLPQ